MTWAGVRERVSPLASWKDLGSAYPPPHSQTFSLPKRPSAYCTASFHFRTMTL